MPNIGAVLKEEISRIARKETRKLVDPLKKQVIAQRREIAALKRERGELSSQLARLGKDQRRAAAPVADGDARTTTRFSAAGLQSLRRRLGLSAEAFGVLVGVSGQSVYNWEQGKARPRARQLEQIGALRGTGKKEALAMLESASAEAAPAKKKRRKRA